ncbi:MAG: ATPase domain-containing protein [Myxococcaceae bacterium]
MRHEAALLETGLPALDEILGGGIPARHVLLIAGHPGSGKTILAGQMAFAQASRGAPVLLATAACEPHHRLLESMQGFGFFQRERIGRDIFLLSIYPWLRKGARETREMLLSSVRERKARMLVIDGLRSLRDVWRDEPSIREFLAELGIGLASNDCTGVFTLESSPDRIVETSEAATADSVMTLWWERNGVQRQRSLEVLKVRGRQHVGGEHAADLAPEGFRVFRRVESLPAPALRPRPEERSPLGITGLDEALGGGVARGSVTLVSGDEGTGKSTVAAAFARGAERSILACLSGAAPTAFGANVWTPPPGERSADELAHALLDRKAALGVHRIVIDDAELLVRSLRPESRAGAWWSALIGALRDGGVEVLLTRPRGAPWPAREAVENHLELRRIEQGGQAWTEAWMIKAGNAGVERTGWRVRIEEGRLRAFGEGFPSMSESAE